MIFPLTGVCLGSATNLSHEFATEYQLQISDKLLVVKD